jgi:glyceraldehyde 3-phosphate dehydrogenase
VNGEADMTRIALNGLGRIGKLALRDLCDTGSGGEIVLVNEPYGDADQHALLLEFDTVYGRWDADIASREDGFSVNGQHIRLTREKGIEDIPLIEMVIDCSGVFKTEAALAPYFAAEIKKSLSLRP